VKTVTWSWCW